MKTMHSFLLGLIFMTISYHIVAQIPKNNVTLQWKIAPNDTIAYKTNIIKVEDSTQTPRDFPAALLPFFKQSKKMMTQQQQRQKKENGQDEGENLMAAMMTAMKKVAYAMNGVSNKEKVTHLTVAQNGVAHIDMFTAVSEQELAEEREELKQMFLKMEENDSIPKKPNPARMDSTLNAIIQEKPRKIPFVSGDVYLSGGLYSFYLDAETRNTIALFFELPTKSVKIKDIWDINTQLINLETQMDECNTAYKQHKITLKSLKRNGKDTIALIEYDLEELADGSFIPYSRFPTIDKVTPNKAKHHTTYKALAEFSVNKGKWLKYDGVLVATMEADNTILKGPNTTITLYSLREE